MKGNFNIKDIRGLTLDSRQVQSGYLFGALPGSKMDGRDYIAEAVRNGASVILAPEGTVMPDLFSEQDGLLIIDQNPRRRFAEMAAEFYGQQPDYSVAVTGTNGKTSCVHFVKQLWEARDIRCASIGTLGVRGAGEVRSGSMTTPDPAALQADVADMAAVGVTHLAMEASSHGLDQYRLDGMNIKAAGFTSLSRDHLDYHKDMAHYFAAKTRLFSEILVEGGVAILNADIIEYDALNVIAKERNLDVISYGFKGKDLKLLSAQANPHGQLLKLEIFGESFEVDLPLVGEFQAMNALCSLGLVLAEGRENLHDYMKALGGLHGAPGRLDIVEGHPSGAAIYIDYAHTPDALEHVLKALRPHTLGRLVCVFGCGGGRDAGKRSIMGRIASDYADHVIVTDDNPRSEDPALIRADILQGANKDAQEIEGRAEAIAAAVALLEKGDVLLVAGKGHEQGQVFVDHTEEFDDRNEVQKAIQELKL